MNTKRAQALVCNESIIHAEQTRILVIQVYRQPRHIGFTVRLVQSSREKFEQHNRDTMSQTDYAMPTILFAFKHSMKLVITFLATTVHHDRE